MLSLWDKITGTWAVAAGISLTFTFLKQYRARPRYIYLGLLGLWIGIWGIQVLRQNPLIPRWGMWLVFLMGIATMFHDSARRYRETRNRIRTKRLEKLRRDLGLPPDEPDPR